MKYAAQCLWLGIFSLVISLNAAVRGPASWNCIFHEWLILLILPYFLTFSGLVATKEWMGEEAKVTRLMFKGKKIKWGWNQLIELTNTFLDVFWIISVENQMDFSAFSLESCQASVATLVCRELGTRPDLGVGTEPARMPCGSWCLKVWIVVGMGSLLPTVFPGGWGSTNSWGAVNFNGYFEIFISYIYGLICHCKSEGLILGYSFTEVIFLH